MSGHGAEMAALVGFRSDLYGCLTGWADALFELCDAVLCSPSPVGSVPALSLEPVFRRSHGSLYKALAFGDIDIGGLRELLIANLPVSGPLVFAVDASTWDRCDAETSPERGFYYSASKHSAGQPIVAGWNYQWISQLEFTPDSWTAPCEVMRIPPTADSANATVDQIRRLVARLGGNGDVPMFVFDAGYDPIALSVGLADVRAQMLTRISSGRVFHPDPVPRPAGTMGRPRRHGARFALSEPDTWPEPDAEHTIHDPRYGDVRVQAWSGMHPKLHGRGRWADADMPPIVRGTVIRVEVEHLPKPTARAVKTLWLWWSGPGAPDLDLCWRAYLRRFDIEHTFRFAKSTLGWTTPALRTPEQADRWTWLNIAAYTQLRLARGLVDDLRMPWERPRPPTLLTPPGCDEGFADYAPPSAHPPTHRNPTHPDPDAPKAPENHHEPAIQPSRKPPDQPPNV